ncbi:helical backbone metal receptor [Gracilimonas sp.]|uniref:helical backbone metal receptor n=1 Tax=Gracilimonas sp. TaxID=1974203 RepID=UPI003BA9E81B
MPDLPYTRIISLVPSLTELLVDLGLIDQLIGRTRFCIHPEGIDDVEIIGGTKNPNLEKIVELKPDFIVANKEENRKEDIELLKKYTKVRVTEIDSIQDAILEISSLGEILGVKEKAGAMVNKITALLNDRPSKPPLSVAYFIWKDPWMTIGNDTYIHDVLHKYGLDNVYGLRKRYPKTNLDELLGHSPELILLSSEPYPFKEKHIDEIKSFCPDSRIELINGEWFSWYGSRMTKAFSFLNDWRASL